MDMDEGFELIMMAQNQYAEDRMYLRWVMNYQHMNFSEFKNQLLTPQNNSSNDAKSKDEILDMVERILDKNEHI